MNLGSTFLKNYSFSLVLIGSIILGTALGAFLGEQAVLLKPLGDLFLNMLFTIVVPIVFFSMASAMAGMRDGKRLGRILGWMIVIFIVTALVSSLCMLATIKIFSPTDGITLILDQPPAMDQRSLGEQIVQAFTVPDFGLLLSRKNMLALIVVSILVGLSAAAIGEKAKPFSDFLRAGSAVMSKMLSYVMLYAPIGLGAYFAYLVGRFGSELLGSYFRVIVIYYPMALLYFFIGFTCYAWIGGGWPGTKSFWRNIISPSITAWATGSSVATIPSNLEAAERIGIPEDIREVVIPIGATIHMEGSCMAAIMKIAVLFGLYQMDFSGADVLVKAVGIAILSGVVMSGIPSGGFLGELLIVTLYGFPIEALPLISMMGTFVDPPATMVNAVGDNVSSMMIARITEGKNWIQTKAS